ncbi:MAG: hypothetical protein PUP91_21705, partial [Rhizonema sp. PD37]|nr:hypothetical protein [Rhizonema sp. PD37]
NLAQRSPVASLSTPLNGYHFFNKNQYLRCAIHPLIVSTKQALNCSDYCPKSSKNETETIDDND